MQRSDYEQAVEMARRWIAEHGRYPQQQEWKHWAPGRPDHADDQATVGLGRADDGGGRSWCAEPKA